MTERQRILSLLPLLLLVAFPDPVAAYIGPGAGLAAIGAALAVVASVVFGVLGFVWYPLKRLFRGTKKGGDEGEAALTDS